MLLLGQMVKWSNIEYYQGLSETIFTYRLTIGIGLNMTF
jgi:hypothetical protein